MRKGCLRCGRGDRINGQEKLMYYTLGDTTLHFYRYQCKFYVAHWDGVT